MALVVKSLSANAGGIRDTDSIPGSGGSPGGGHGNRLRYSCLENPVDRGGWRTTVHGISKSRSRLKRLSTHTVDWLLHCVLKYILHLGWKFLRTRVTSSVKRNKTEAQFLIHRRNASNAYWLDNWIGFNDDTQTLGSWILAFLLFSFLSSVLLLRKLCPHTLWEFFEAADWVQFSTSLPPMVTSRDHLPTFTHHSTLLHLPHVVILSGVWEKPELEKWWLDWDALHRKMQRFCQRDWFLLSWEPLASLVTLLSLWLCSPVSLCLSEDALSTLNDCFIPNPNPC